MGKLLVNTSVELSSEKKSIKVVEPLVMDLRRVMKLKDELFYNILIAVTEAVNNALIHGNRLEAEKKVNIIIHADRKKITVEVIDQGRGFDPDLLSDPRQPENLLKENGRGVFLIRQLTHDCKYVFSGTGSRLIMHFLVD